MTPEDESRIAGLEVAARNNITDPDYRDFTGEDVLWLCGLARRIESAERERCAKAVEGVYLDYDCCARAARQMLTAIREGKS